MTGAAEPLGMTGLKVGAIRAELEREGPYLVGRVLFAFGRLEFNLVLHIASFGHPSTYETRRAQLEGDSFALKLDRLRKLARAPQLSPSA